MESGQIEVLYFAEAALRVGARSERIELKSMETLAQLQSEVFRRHPALESLRSHLRWSLDEELGSDEASLQGVRCVAVLPPYSGG